MKFYVEKKSVPFVKINGFYCSLTDSSVNFRKPPFVNGTLPSPCQSYTWSQSYTIRGQSYTWAYHPSPSLFEVSSSPKLFKFSPIHGPSPTLVKVSPIHGPSHRLFKMLVLYMVLVLHYSRLVLFIKSQFYTIQGQSYT